MGIGTLDPASNAAQVLESNSYEANNQVVWVSSRANVPERGSGQRLLALTCHQPHAQVQLEVPLEATREALRLARAHEVFSILNPAPAPRGGLDQVGRPRKARSTAHQCKGAGRARDTPRALEG